MTTTASKDSLKVEEDIVLETMPLDALGRFATKREETYLSVREEPAFVLTSWPWRETSLIVSLFTKHYGRVTTVARGAKRVAGRFRGLLDPFSPLLVNFSGKGEVRTLTAARWMGGLAPISGEGLLTGFYLNELIFRLMPAEVSHTDLFEAYTATLTKLSYGKWQDADRAVREFEVDLLRLSGWGQRLVDKSAGFTGFVRAGEIVDVSQYSPYPEEKLFDPATVRAVLMRDFSDARTLKGAREMLRLIIEFYALGGKTLSSRKTLSKWRRFRAGQS